MARGAEARAAMVHCVAGVSNLSFIEARTPWSVLQAFGNFAAVLRELCHHLLMEPDVHRG